LNKKILQQDLIVQSLIHDWNLTYFNICPSFASVFFVNYQISYVIWYLKPIMVSF
jgi:hypothetical protein